MSPVSASTTPVRREFLIDHSLFSTLQLVVSSLPCNAQTQKSSLNCGLEAFRKRESADRLSIAFPGGGALAASIWPIADYQACHRPLNQLDRT